MKIRPSYLRFYVTLLAALIMFSLRDTFAQSLGDLARQERARKLARQSRVTKVYTNEDLKREVIVDPAERTADEMTLADSAPVDAPAPAVPVHLTFAAPVIPAKELTAPAPGVADRAVPTVPIWPAGMPLGDVARYYRQQIAPQIPGSDNSDLQQALAQTPAVRDYGSDRLQVTLVSPAAMPVAATPVAAPTQRSAVRELNLPAPFVMASAEGSSIPVIENVAEETIPGFTSPAVKLQMASTSAEQRPIEVAAAREGLRFEAPDMSEVVLSFDANASLGIPSIGGAEFAGPMYDSSRDPLVIRFAAPEKAAAPSTRPTPIARTTNEVAQPQVRATLASTSSLETVSPWRYADEIPPAPALVSPTHTVVASTIEQAPAPAAQPDGHEVRVQRGDSLWLLALRHLGDGHAWPQIAAANPQITDPNRIAAGELVLIPAVAANRIAEVAAPAHNPVAAGTDGRKSVVVRQGDSLWKLAESTMGDGAAWNCIAAANPQITDANRIFAGQTLVLPSACDSHS